MDDNLLDISNERAIELLTDLNKHAVRLLCDHGSLKLLEVSMALGKAIKLLEKEK